MSNLIFDISDNLCESIAKSRAVVDLLQATDSHNLSNDTLPDIGWLLDCELKRMQKQVDRLIPKPGN
jgi:hypothetical protein